MAPKDFCRHRRALLSALFNSVTPLISYCPNIATLNQLRFGSRVNYLHFLLRPF
jgi:hypothetical protein